MDAEEIGDLLIATQADKVRDVTGRLLESMSRTAVLLMGDERADEIARILQDEVKINNVAAYDLIAELRKMFAPPEQPESEPNNGGKQIKL
jgi:hypothetical protein